MDEIQGDIDNLKTRVNRLEQARQHQLDALAKTVEEKCTYFDGELARVRKSLDANLNYLNGGVTSKLDIMSDRLTELFDEKLRSVESERDTLLEKTKTSVSESLRASDKAAWARFATLLITIIVFTLGIAWYLGQQLFIHIIQMGGVP